MKELDVPGIGKVTCFECEDNDELKYEILSHYPVIPAVQGHYFLFDKEGRLLYIGKSNNLRSRVSGHVSGNGGCVTKKFCDSISYVYIHECFKGTGKYETSLLSKERGFIQKFKPAFNGASSGTTTVEDSYGYKNLRDALNDGENPYELIKYWDVSEIAISNITINTGEQEKPSDKLTFTEAIREAIKVIVKSGDVGNSDEIIDGLLSGLKAVSD